jgi:hypothetical protein
VPPENPYQRMADQIDREDLRSRRTEEREMWLEYFAEESDILEQETARETAIRQRREDYRRSMAQITARQEARRRRPPRRTFVPPPRQTRLPAFLQRRILQESWLSYAEDLRNGIENVSFLWLQQVNLILQQIGARPFRMPQRVSQYEIPFSNG